VYTALFIKEAPLLTSIALGIAAVLYGYAQNNAFIKLALPNKKNNNKSTVFRGNHTTPTHVRKTPNPLSSAAGRGIICGTHL
jgi:hypothetical protein